MIRQIAGLGLVVLLLSSAYTQNYGDEDMEQRPMEGGRGDMGTMGGRRRMNRMRGGRGGESGEMEGMADGRGGMRGGRRGMGGGRGGMDDGMGGKGGGRGGMGGDRGGMGGGRGGMDDGMGGKGGGRGGMGGGRGGMGGDRGGMGGGRGGMGGGMGGMGGGRGGRGGMGGGRRGMGRRRGGMGGGKGGIRAMMNRRMQGNHRLDAMIDGMQNFSQDTSYDENSKLMLVYKGTFARSSDVDTSDCTLDVFSKTLIFETLVKGNLVGQMRLLSTRLVLLNADNEVKTALSEEVGTAIKEVTDKWNKKCQGTFAELIEEIGDNPPPADMKTAKRTLEKVAGRYISEVLKLMEKLTKKVQKQDKGWFVDGLTTNEGKLNIMRAMMKDVRRLKTFFSSELDHAMATLKPHFDDKHVPTMSESFLIKQLMNVQKRAMGEFGLNIRGMMQEAVGRDRTAPFDLEKLKSVLHETEKKKNKALKRAVKEMKAIVELNQVDPKVADLKDKLVAKSRDIFRKVKEGKAGEMAKIMHDMVQKVQGKPGAKMVEMMLRKESTQVLAEIQNKMGKAVKKHCEKALKSGGSTDEEFEKALPELREEIAEYMESAASELKKFAEEKVKEIEEGKGIFAKVKALKERQGRRKGRKGGRGGRGEMGQGGRGGMGRRGRGGMGHRGRGGMGEEGMSEEGRGRMRPRGRGGMGEEGMGEGGRGGMRPRGRGGMGEEVMGEGGMGGRRGRMPPPRGGREQRGGMEERY